MLDLLELERAQVRPDGRRLADLPDGRRRHHQRVALEPEAHPTQHTSTAGNVRVHLLNV